MYGSHTVGVVIPVYNEANFITAVLDGLPHYIDRVVVVDDASTDGSARVASAHRRHPTVITHATNQGVGASVMDGYAAMVEMGVDVVVRLDGDGQMDPKDMPGLLQPVVAGNAGLAKGNRFGWGRVPPAMPVSRRLGNIALTFLTKTASGYWHIFDPQNGYSAISARAIGALDYKYLHRTGYFFENALLIELNSAEIPVVDVPTSTIYGQEVSGISIMRVLTSFPARLAHGWARRMFRRYVLLDFSPVALFLGSGSMLFVAGLVFGIGEWIESATTGITASTGSVMLAVLPVLIGFELMLQALVLDINGSPREWRSEMRMRADELIAEPAADGELDWGEKAD